MAEESVSLPIALVSLGMVAGAYLGGEVARRDDPQPLGAVSFVLSAALAVGLVFAPRVEVYLVLGFLFVLFQGLPFPYIVIKLTTATGRHRAAALGQFTATTQFGGFLGSLIGSVVVASLGYRYLGVLSAAGTVIGAATLLLLPRSRTLHIPRRRLRRA